MIKKSTVLLGKPWPEDWPKDDYFKKVQNLKVIWLEFRMLIEGCCQGIPPEMILPNISHDVIKRTLVPYLVPKVTPRLAQAIAISKRVQFRLNGGGRGACHYCALFYVTGKDPEFMVDMSVRKAIIQGFGDDLGSSIAMDKPTLEQGTWKVSGYWIPTPTPASSPR